MNPRNLSLTALAVVFPLASGLALAQSKTPEGVLTASYKMPNYKALCFAKIMSGLQTVDSSGQ